MTVMSNMLVALDVSLLSGQKEKTHLVHLFLCFCLRSQSISSLPSFWPGCSLFLLRESQLKLAQAWLSILNCVQVESVLLRSDATLQKMPNKDA